MREKRTIFDRPPLNDDDADAVANSSLVLFVLYEQRSFEKAEARRLPGFRLTGYIQNRQRDSLMEVHTDAERRERRFQTSFANALAERTNERKFK